MLNNTIWCDSYSVCAFNDTAMKQRDPAWKWPFGMTCMQPTSAKCWNMVSRPGVYQGLFGRCVLSGRGRKAEETALQWYWCKFTHTHKRTHDSWKLSHPRFPFAYLVHSPVPFARNECPEFDVELWATTSGRSRSAASHFGAGIGGA